MTITKSADLLTVLGGKDTGTASSATTTTLVDSAKSWTTNDYAGRTIQITGGTGVKQVREVVSNTATSITVSYAWDTTPDATSTYIISYDFDDIQAADDAGSWGVVTTQGNQHYLDVELRIGNTSDDYSYLSDKNKAIKIDRNRMKLGRNGTLQLGEINEHLQTKNGCSFELNETTTSYNFGAISTAANQVGDFRAYGSIVIAPIFWGFYTTGTQTDMLVDIVDCITKAWGRIEGDNSRLLRVKNYEPAGYGAWTIKAPFGSIQDVTVSQGTGYGLYYYGSISRDVRAEEFNVSNVGATTFLMRSSGGTQYTLQVVNSDIENWTFQWDSSATLCDRIYTVNWHITDVDGVDIDGATITLTDADENEVFSEDTNSEGRLDSDQDVVYAEYRQANGNTPDLQGPFTLNITKGADVYETVIDIPHRIDDEAISLGTGGGGGSDAPTVEEIADEIMTRDIATATKQGTNETKLVAIQADLDNPSQYKADVSSLATSAALSAVQADLDNPGQFKADVSGLAPSGEYDTILGDIVADTNELQADDVPGLISGLNNISVAEVNTAITNAALASASALSVVDGIVDAILADTDELQSNQGEWTTATGFSQPNEYDVRLATIQSDLDNPDQFKADISGVATTGEYSAELAALQADLDNPDQFKADVTGLATAEEIADAVWNKELP